MKPSGRNPGSDLCRLGGSWWSPREGARESLQYAKCRAAGPCRIGPCGIGARLPLPAGTSDLREQALESCPCAGTKHTHRLEERPKARKATDASGEISTGRASMQCRHLCEVFNSRMSSYLAK